MKEKIIISNSPEETKKIAGEILKELNKRNIISLEGELGSGKTIFAQGFAKALGIRSKIKSPTFVIIKKYNVRFKKQGIKTLYHLDCYRIKNAKEILELGWKKIIDNPENIILVEWGNKIKKELPKNTIHLKFKFEKENTREIKKS